MSEQELSHEELEAFREELKEALDSTVFIITSGQDAGPFNVDPMSLGLGEGTMTEISAEKSEIIKEELYVLAGIEDQKPIVTTYTASDDENIAVAVIEAEGFNEEGEAVAYFIHEIKHQNGEFDWQLSASSDPLL